MVSNPAGEARGGEHRRGPPKVFLHAQLDKSGRLPGRPSDRAKQGSDRQRFTRPSNIRSMAGLTHEEEEKANGQLIARDQWKQLGFKRRSNGEGNRKEGREERIIKGTPVNRLGGGEHRPMTQRCK